MRSVLFGIFTALIFLNIGLGEHEIFPYWMILTPLFFKEKILKTFIILSVFIILFIVNFIIFDNFSLYVIDSFQVLSVVLACVFFKELNNKEQALFFKIITAFIWFQCIVMILQYILPAVQLLTAKYFAGRSSDLVIVALTRNNAVTGFSPEPSYGSSLLVGLYFLKLIYSNNSKLIIIPVVVSLFLFKSVYGFIIFFLFTFIYLYKKSKYFYPFLLINVILFFFTINISITNTSLARFLSFVNEIITSKSLLNAEKFVSTDSNRLDFLLIFNNLSDRFNYYKSISVGVYLLQATHFVLILFLIFLLLFSNPRLYGINLIITILVFLITPILVWPTFFVLISLLEYKKININEIFYN